MGRVFAWCGGFFENGRISRPVSHVLLGERLAELRSTLSSKGLQTGAERLRRSG